jgi:hypothetical protein
MSEVIPSADILRPLRTRTMQITLSINPAFELLHLTSFGTVRAEKQIIGTMTIGLHHRQPLRPVLKRRDDGAGSAPRTDGFVQGGRHAEELHFTAFVGIRERFGDVRRGKCPGNRTGCRLRFTHFDRGVSGAHAGDGFGHGHA